MKSNSRMILLARESAGLTQISLAHSLSLSQAYLSKIEHGMEEPSDEILEKIANECNVPIEFFAESDQILGEGIVDFFHRKRLTLPSKPLKKAQAQANMVRLEVSRLLRSFDLTDVAPFPTIPDEKNVTPEEAAEIVRRTWWIPSGPLPNLVGLVEKAGIPVLLFDLGHTKLSAMSIPGLCDRYIILLNKNQSPSTQRFSLAHELGHLVMHSRQPSECMEEEADRFAASLLMPRADIDSQLHALHFRDLGSLKLIWKVSFAALIYRANKLGHISKRQYRSFFVQLNQLKAGSSIEPDEPQREEPRLIRTVIDMYKSDLGYSDEEIARVMIATKEAFQQKYLGVETQTLKSVGRPTLRSISLS